MSEDVTNTFESDESQGRKRGKVLYSGDETKRRNSRLFVVFKNLNASRRFVSRDSEMPRRPPTFALHFICVTPNSARFEFERVEK